MRVYCLKQLLLLFLFVGVGTVNAQTIAGGDFHSLIICADGTVRSWGYNNSGQLGDSTTVYRSTPGPVAGLTDIVKVAAGDYHSIFLKNDSTVWTCGYNYTGQLGEGSNIDRYTPVEVVGLTGIGAVSAGGEHSLFLKNDSTVWACGANSSGQLGDGTTISKATPVQVGGLTGIIAVAAGRYHSLFLKNDGTVWACGYNISGQLGDGTTVNKSTPVLVSGLVGITAVAGGYNHSLFLKNDSSVWACGNNNNGELGDGTTVHKYIPVQVAGLTAISGIAAGSHSLFLKDDGTTWTCGYNASGQLGDGTTIDKLIPVQVSGLTSIKTVAAGYNHSLFLKNDGTLWVCGSNTSGELGDGTTTNRLTPVQTMGLCVVKGAKGVHGSVFLDLNQNCFRDSGEITLSGRRAIINPGNIIVQTDAAGTWHIDSLPAGTYTITADTSGKWQRTCPAVQSFTVTNPDSLIFAPDFGFVSTKSCAAPDVSVYMPFLRPGFSNQKIYVTACNTNLATGALSSAYADLELDSLIIPQSASIAYTALGNNIYRFNLGNLNPGQCVNFTVSCSLSVNATLGKTLCMEAALYPADSCVFDTIADFPGDVTPCTLPWDKSSLMVDGWCLNDDSIRFVIYNTGNSGDGNMQCYSLVRLYIDGLMVKLDSVKINGGDSVVYVFAGDGRTWRLEAGQHPLHPGNSHPNATIEACGNNANWTSGLVNNLPHDDADPVVDIYCGVVTGSYDPNDKRGFPGGVRADHAIMPNQQLQYVIRFQNTGTDTAFMVVIKDTLDTDLDIFSVQSGTSSHNYSFRMYGPRVLEWTFNNILLPDSNINEPASHGFVTFTVNQNKNLPNGTPIENSAGIYFDFNAPIITNTTKHTVNEQIRSKPGIETAAACDSYTWSVNGKIYTSSGIYPTVITNGSGDDSTVVLYLTIQNLDTSVTQSQNTLTANATGAAYQWINCDNGNNPIADETSQSFTATANGNYAVIVTENGCTDTSACYAITGIGIMENSFGAGLKVFPNPTNGRLSIDLAGSYKDITVQVRNIAGQLVFKESFGSSQLVELNLEGLANGIYMIKIAAAGKSAVVRVVKGE